MKVTIGALEEPIQVVSDSEYNELQETVTDLEDITMLIEQSLSEYLTGTVEWAAVTGVATASSDTPGIARLANSGDSSDIATLKYVKSRSGANGVPTSRTVNGYPLTDDITLDGTDVNSMTEKEVDAYMAEEAKKHSLVPTSRQVQGKPLTGDIVITADSFGEGITEKEAKDKMTWVYNGVSIEPLRTTQFKLYGKQFVNGELTYTKEDTGVLGPEQFYEDEQNIYEYAKKVADTSSRVGLYVRYMFVGTTSSQTLDYTVAPEKNTTITATSFRSGFSHPGGGKAYGENIGYFTKVRLGPEVFVPASEKLVSSSADNFTRLITKVDTVGNRYYRMLQFCLEEKGEEVWK